MASTGIRNTFLFPGIPPADYRRVHWNALARHSKNAEAFMNHVLSKIGSAYSP